MVAFFKIYGLEVLISNIFFEKAIFYKKNFHT